MFAIALKQLQYATYILTDETTQSRLAVVPERGGIIVSWQVQGKELLYLDTERFTNPDLTVRGGIPILFPICGNIPNNAYTHNGKTYTLKQHGFARDLPWEATEQVTEGKAAITLVLNSNEDTRERYPFDFQLAFTYQIQGNSLEIHQRFSNRSDQPMPFSTGLHPYFLVTDKTQLRFDIPATQFQDHRNHTLQGFSGSFDFEADEIDVAFRPVSAQTARVHDSSQPLHLTLQYDSLYSTLVFWTVKGKDFYCLEPWSAPRNALNTGESLTQLAPGESLETTIRFTAEL